MNKGQSNIISKPWIKYFYRFLPIIASNSKCIHRKVGALIVDQYKNIISTGYNGLPSNYPHCSDVGCFIKERESGTVLHNLPCVHAEINALIRSRINNISTTGAFMFVSIFPCNDCLKAIITAGISRLYYLQPYKLSEGGEQCRKYLLDKATRFTVIQINNKEGEFEQYGKENKN